MKIPKEKNTAPAEPLKPLELPKGPYIIRDDRGVATSCTDAGLGLIRIASAEGCAQQYIASKLGISYKTFERLLGKASDDPMRPERAAYEEGQGELKSELVRLTLQGARRGGLVQPLFLLKSIFGLRDQGPATQIDVGNRIEFVLPAPAASVADQLKIFGQTRVIDTRPTPMIIEHMRMQKKSEDEIQRYLRDEGRTDYESPPLKLLPPTNNTGG